MVQVINTKNRLYNGVKKGGIINIPAEKVFEYEIAWFSVIEEKKNIVKAPVVPSMSWLPGIDDSLTIPQLKEQLNHLGVNYDNAKVKLDYQKLLSEALTKPTGEEKWDETSEDNEKNIDDLKQQLVDEKIVDESELEGKTDDEITQIATDNWLI